MVMFFSLVYDHLLLCRKNMTIYYREEHVHRLQRRTCPYTTEKNMTIYYREEHVHILQRRT
jgi:hypothetical protein